MAKDKRIIFFYKKKNIFTSNNKGPKEFLYGLDYLKKHFPVKALFANQYQTRHFAFKISEKLFARQTQVGIHFQAYLNNNNKINKKDLLFCVEDGTSFGLLFFKLLGLLNNKLIILIQGLHDRYKYYQGFKLNKPIVFFCQKLLQKADYILTLSEYEKQLLKQSFKLNNKVGVLYFGVDTNFWDKNKAGNKNNPKDFILTVGNDMHRDYNLLIDHYSLKIPLKFITKNLNNNQRSNLKNNPLFENDSQISNHHLRKLYHQAKLVIVPLKTTFATSGLSATLQALAMEKPVLLAKTPAMTELFKDYQQVLYYEVNNPCSFKEKLNELNNNFSLRIKLAKNARKIIEKKFNSKNMGKQVLAIMKTF